MSYCFVYELLERLMFTKPFPNMANMHECVLLVGDWTIAWLNWESFIAWSWWKKIDFALPWALNPCSFGGASDYQ